MTAPRLGWAADDGVDLSLARRCRRARVVERRGGEQVEAGRDLQFRLGCSRVAPV